MSKGKTKNWTMTESAFQKFLEWLDEGEDSDGRKYLEMRRRLVNYFDRKNCLTPDSLADETLNRTARRLEEEGAIESETPAKFCYITARFVFLEHLRDADKTHVPLDERLEQSRAAGESDREEREKKEKMLNCLEHCAARLEPPNREIIEGYYFGETRAKIDNRRTLAQSLGISVNALSIRACRIRDRLETCVRECAAAE